MAGQRDLDKIDQRLATLEHLVQEHIHRDEVAHKELGKDISELVILLSRYKGFVGGMLFAGSCLGAAVTMILQYFRG